MNDTSERDDLDTLLELAGARLDAASAARRTVAGAQTGPLGDRDHRRSPLLVAAAVVLAAGGVTAAIVAMRHNDQTIPASNGGADSVPDEPAVTPVVDNTAPPVPAVVDDSAVPPTVMPTVVPPPDAATTTTVAALDPAVATTLPSNVAPLGALLSVDQPTGVAPLVLLDGWSIDYLNGSGSGVPQTIGPNDRRVVLVGDGPRYDAAWFTAQVYDLQGSDLSTFGDPIDINGIAGRVTTIDVDVDTKLAGPVIDLRWALPDGLVAAITTTRLSLGTAIDMASTVVFGADGPEMQTPTGFTRLADPAPAEQTIDFEYQYSSDGKSLQLDGTNQGVYGLLARIGTEVRTTRLVDDVELAYRPLPGEPGHYWADWQVGGWSYYVDANGFASEDEFLSALASLRTVDNATFAAAAASLDPILPGSQLDHLMQLVDGLPLPVNSPVTPTGGEFAPNAVATTTSAYDAEFLTGLACGWTHTFDTATAAGDTAGAAAAADAIDAIAVRAPEKFASDFRAVADSMRTGVPLDGRQHGDLACPSWSATVG